jgi:hypothetical protein
MSDEKICTEHLVAYIDLLGFKEAIKNNTQEDEIFKLLKSFQEATGNSKVEDSGDACLGVSVFSDHVVISVRIKDMTYQGRSCSIEFLKAFQLAISGFARLALAHGFLIRGGITVGELFHDNGIVFGKALVEAYELESEVAIYPRVIISKKLAPLFETEIDIFSEVDFDGILSLKYLEGVLCENFKDSDYKKEINFKVEHFVPMIKENLEKYSKLTTSTGLKILSKWQYFSNHFQEAQDEALGPRVQGVNVKMTLDGLAPTQISLVQAGEGVRD